MSVLEKKFLFVKLVLAGHKKVSLSLKPAEKNHKFVGAQRVKKKRGHFKRDFQHESPLEKRDINVSLFFVGFQDNLATFNGISPTNRNVGK